MEIKGKSIAGKGWYYSSTMDTEATIRPLNGAVVLVINQNTLKRLHGIYDGTSILKGCVEGVGLTKFIGDINLELLSNPEKITFHPVSDRFQYLYFQKLHQNRLKWNQERNKLESELSLEEGDFFSIGFMYNGTFARVTGIFKSAEQVVSVTGEKGVCISTFCQRNASGKFVVDGEAFAYERKEGLDIRKATPTERKILFDTININGCEWFEKERYLSKLNTGATVYGIDSKLIVIPIVFDRSEGWCRMDEKKGALFPSKEEAEKYAVEFRRMLKERSLE